MKECSTDVSAAKDLFREHSKCPVILNNFIVKISFELWLHFILTQPKRFYQALIKINGVYFIISFQVKILRVIQLQIYILTN